MISLTTTRLVSRLVEGWGGLVVGSSSTSADGSSSTPGGSSCNSKREQKLYRTKPILQERSLTFTTVVLDEISNRTRVLKAYRSLPLLT